MPYGTVNADTLVTSTSGGILGAGNASIMKNRIINGAMVIDQRNAGASVTATTSAPYSVDRFFVYSSPTSKFTAQQNAGSVTPPVGFVNYLGCTSSSAYTVSGTDITAIAQRIEGNNLADLGWGTANAKTVTLSFQVYSSLTGTFGGSVQNGNADRSYPFTYTISAANTWTSISVTIAGDTTGTWSATTGTGMQLWFGLGVGATRSGTANTWAGANYVSATGATSVVGTNGATFYITGVQLEVGSSATGFEYRIYGTELANCQRYYQTWGGVTNFDCIGAVGACTSTTDTEIVLSMPINMRANPTATYSALTDWFAATNSSSAITAFSTDLQTTKVVRLNVKVTTASLTTGNAVYIRANNTTSARYNLSAEL
jgi:hypothetical protein